MANQILTGDRLTRAFLCCLDAAVQACRGVASRPHAIYTHCFQGRGGNKGDTVMLRRPVSLLSFLRDDPFEPITTQRAAVNLTTATDVYVKVDDRELTLSLREFSTRYLEPMAYHMARDLDDVWPEGATLVTADLAHVSGVQWSAYCADPDSGLCVRGVGFQDFQSRAQVLRFDMLCGFTTEAATAVRYSPVVYQVTAAEAEMLDLLMEAKAELVARRELLRWVA